MKQTLKDLITTALDQPPLKVLLREIPYPEIRIDRTRDPRHGDFASNVAMVLARLTGRNPQELARQIVASLPASDLVERVEVAGPGFINFFLKPAYLRATVRQVLAQGPRYGRSTLGKGERVQVEFVSANPTGPLHIGHGRGAAYGAAIANLLEAAGFEVEREYYVNDAGRQMDILAVSVWLRYLELGGEPVTFPDNAYRGSYVKDIARDLRAEVGDEFQVPWNHVLPGLTHSSDPETHLDTLIQRTQELLGAARYRRLYDYGLNQVLEGIRKDLADFGVYYDRWFSERSLLEDHSVDRALERLEAVGRIYTQEGARWFNSTAFGDEKNRVVVRENGQKTYFASDIAYHLNKFERGFDRVIDLWGADHHGYVARIKAALAALNLDPNRLEILLVQFATLYRGSQRLQMSTRAGEFVTLRELMEEVGKDAARFFYVMRRCEQHLEFDLELAKSQSADNPVYYVQYAHARIASVFRQLTEKGLSWSEAEGMDALDQLTEPEEQVLLTTLSRYPEVVESAALSREPHQLAHYLHQLASEFHVYYNAHRFLAESDQLRNARLNLIAAIQQVIRNGLTLLGVSAPEAM